MSVRQLFSAMSAQRAPWRAPTSGVRDPAPFRAPAQDNRAVQACRLWARVISTAYARFICLLVGAMLAAAGAGGDAAIRRSDYEYTDA